VTTLVVILTALGGALPLYALVEGYLSARKHFARLEDDLRRIKEIHDTPGLPDSEKTRRAKTVRAPEVTAYYWMPYAPAIAERTLYEVLKRPAVLVAVGVVCATAGSLLSLTIGSTR
jgi:hypothetical protein